MDIEQLEKLSHTNPIILYDGQCILCNKFIHFIERNDRQNKFRYLQLQNELGKQVIEKAALKNAEEDTAYLLYKSNYYDRSNVSLKTASLLGFPFSLLTIFKVVPRKLRDMVYNWVANNRYSWFGKTDLCIIPDQSLQAKLI